MQTLNVKVKNPDGTVSEKKVQVLRCFQDANGMQVYLHINGDYGYKDQAPVKSENELKTIGDRRQRELALLWWNSIGKKKSEEFYAAQDEAIAKRAGDFQATPKIGETELDFILYQSRPAGGKEKDWSDPFPWMGKFPTRPDWWGQMVSAAFKDVEYRMSKPEDQSIKPVGSVKGI